MLGMVFDNVRFTFDFINCGQLGWSPDSFIRAADENVAALFDSKETLI